jgi:hypothetical protein
MSNQRPDPKQPMIDALNRGIERRVPRYDGTNRDKIMVDFTFDGRAYHAVFGTNIAKRHCWFVYPGPSREMRIHAMDPIETFVYEPIVQVYA